MRTYAAMERRGPGFMGWIIAGIVLLSIGGLVATVVISVRHDVSSGYIPPEARRPAVAAPDALAPSP